MIYNTTGLCAHCLSNKCKIFSLHYKMLLTLVPAYSVIAVKLLELEPNMAH